MSEAITNQAREILGDLTTTFTAPEPCWTPAHHLDLNVGWLGQTCGPTDVQERHLLAPDDNRRPKNELSLLQLGILLARPRVPGRLSLRMHRQRHLPGLASPVQDRG